MSNVHRPNLHGCWRKSKYRSCKKGVNRILGNSSVGSFTRAHFIEDYQSVKPWSWKLSCHIPWGIALNALIVSIQIRLADSMEVSHRITMSYLHIVSNQILTTAASPLTMNSSASLAKQTFKMWSVTLFNVALSISTNLWPHGLKELARVESWTSFLLQAQRHRAPPPIHNMCLKIGIRISIQLQEHEVLYRWFLTWHYNFLARPAKMDGV